MLSTRRIGLVAAVAAVVLVGGITAAAVRGPDEEPAAPAGTETTDPEPAPDPAPAPDPEAPPEEPAPEPETPESDTAPTEPTDDEPTADDADEEPSDADEGPSDADEGPSDDEDLSVTERTIQEMLEADQEAAIDAYDEAAERGDED